MKTLMMLRTFPPNYAGAAVQAITLSKRLRIENVDVEFVVDNGANPTRRDTHEGFKVLRIATMASERFVQVRLVIFALKAFVYLIKSKANILFLHGIGGAELLILPLVKLVQRACLVELTGIGYDDPMTIKRRRVGAFFLKCLSYADRIVPISTKLRELSSEAGLDDKKLILIPVGVNTETFFPLSAEDKFTARKHLGFDPTKKLVLAVGKVCPEKRYEHMLEVWLHIQAEFKDATLLIAGPLCLDQKSFILKLNGFTKDNALQVRFLGQIDNVHEYMRIADCLIHCSQAEGLPNTLLEACFANVPIVCQKIPGVTSDIVMHPDIGVEVSSNLPLDFAHQVFRYLRKTPQLLSSELIAKLRDKFDIRTVSQRYLELFKEIT